MRRTRCCFEVKSCSEYNRNFPNMEENWTGKRFTSKITLQSIPSREFQGLVIHRVHITVTIRECINQRPSQIQSCSRYHGSQLSNVSDAAIEPFDWLTDESTYEKGKIYQTGKYLSRYLWIPDRSTIFSMRNN